MCGVHFISQTSLAEIIPLRHALEVAHICITLFKMNMLYINQQKQQKDAPWPIQKNCIQFQFRVWVELQI